MLLTLFKELTGTPLSKRMSEPLVGTAPPAQLPGVDQRLSLPVPTQSKVAGFTRSSSVSI